MMVLYLFSHWEINGVPITEGSEFVLQVEDHTNVVAVYQVPTEDRLEFKQGDFEVWYSVSEQDYYVQNIETQMILMRFPTLAEATQWVLENLPAIGLASLTLIGASLYFLFRRK